MPKLMKIKLKDIRIDSLKSQYKSITNSLPDNITLLPQSGSNRKYYRLESDDLCAIGVMNEDVKENKAFISFSRAFSKSKLPVPEILSEADDQLSYLQTDLGDETLFAFLKSKRKAEIFPKSVLEKYQQVLDWLPKFQTEGVKHIDFSKCYPRAAFDEQSMMWDLNYFKYYFLKLSGVPYDEQLLENDFKALTTYLLSAPSDFFLYRDFQSRNVMIKNDKVYFIDYQGGRKGPLQYDIASLLYDAKADIPEEIRRELLDYYLNQLEKHIAINRQQFIEYYYAFVVIRILQAMGAYGYRGFYERKSHFLQSIPYALKNLELVIPKCKLPREITHLPKILLSLKDANGLKKYLKVHKSKTLLTVTINSFSYKSGLPEDLTGNGGGFIFDCRAIHNPGRYEEFKTLTGRDKEVIDFLQKDGEADVFLISVIQLAEVSVDKYLDRGFTNLQINFGCTGGQHRSVYCAEQLSKHLKNKYEQSIKIKLHHREQKIDVEL